MEDRTEARAIEIAGHPRQLYYTPGAHWCGHIRDGVGFHFAGEGAWVVSLETLRLIVRNEDAIRAAAALSGDAGGEG